MVIQIDENIKIEVFFDIANREDGYDDDITFCIKESGPRNVRIFAADETSLLFTPHQADKLSLALKKAAEGSRKTKIE